MSDAGTTNDESAGNGESFGTSPAWTETDLTALRALVAHFDGPDAGDMPWEQAAELAGQDAESFRQALTRLWQASPPLIEGPVPEESSHPVRITGVTGRGRRVSGTSPPGVEEHGGTAAARLSIEANVVTRPSIVVVDWRTAAREELTGRIESIITHLDLAEIVDLLEGDEKANVRRVLELLGDQTRAAGKPDEGLVKPVLRWLGRKLDRFADAAADSAGDALGKLSVYGPATVVAALMAHVPPAQLMILELVGSLSG